MEAEQLARRLNARRSGRQWVCCCPAHEDREPSLIIFDGRESVQVRCLAGCSSDEVIAELERRGMWEIAKAAPAKPVAALATLRPRKAEEQKRGAVFRPSDDRHRDMAQLIFQQAGSIAGTMAERYFEGRDLLDVARRISDIRFHPSCPRGAARQPAIVVAMRDVATRQVHAIQRIFLRSPGFGTVVKDGAMMLGPASGCAMQLHPRGDGVTLNIAEGLESALAVIAMDHQPAWAMGSASMIASMPVIEGVDRLVIWADHDKVNPATGKQAGEHAARMCGMRWSAAGRRVELMVPRVEGWDAADVWSDRCARQ